MTHLSLALLGPFQATLDEKPISRLKSAKVRALLAYLVIEANHSHRREALAELLWPGKTTRESLGSLRFALSNLRTAIGDRRAAPPFLLITRDTVQFNQAGHYRLDVAQFKALASQNAGGGSAVMRLVQLEQAIELYRGDFLEGLAVADSPAFEEWAMFKREPLHRQMLSALQGLAALHEGQGEYAQAQSYARRQLELEPWLEKAHRQLMRLLALNGERGAALSQYQICRSVLAEELGIEPEQETIALYQSIRDNLFEKGTERQAGRSVEAGSVSPPFSFLSAASPASTLPFVAREQELAQLNGFLERTLAGQGQVAFVTGDAGSGKTALVDQFARQTIEAHGDVVAAWGSCNAQAGIGDPYLPFREILQMLSGDIEAKRAGGAISREHARRLWVALPQTVSALVNNGPDLIDLFIPGSALAARVETFVPAETAQRAQLEDIVRRRAIQQNLDRPVDADDNPAADSSPAVLKQADLFEQVTKVLLALARRCPLLLVLDDLQWADAGSISLLFHLGRRLMNGRILLIGTYRPADVALGHLTSSPSTEEVEGERERHPLEAVVNELQRDFGNSPIDLRQTRGRQFVEAFIDAEPNCLNAAFRKTLYQHTAGNPLFTVELVRGLQDRKGLVQDETGQWVEGPALDWEKLPARVEAIVAERVEKLSPEWQAALAVAGVEGEVFTAEVVARAQKINEGEVIRCLSGPLSKRHYLVQAQSLERLGSKGQRLSRYRFRHFLFQKYLYNRLDSIERAQLHEAVGRVLETLYQDNADTAEGIAAIAPQLAWHFEAAGLVDKAVAYLHQAGDRDVRMSAYQEALAHYTRGLELLKTVPASPERARQELSLQLALGVPLRAVKSYGAPERGRAYARAHQLSLQIGEMPKLFQTLLMQWSYYVPRAEHRQALDLIEQVLALAEQMEDPTQEAMAHIAMGITQIYLGQFTSALAYLNRGLAGYDPQRHHPLATIIGQDPKVSGLAYSSWALLFLGYPDQARQRVQETLELARTLDHPFSLGFVLSVASAVVHLRCGAYDLALEGAEELLQLGANMNFALYQGLGMCTKGRALTEQRRMEEGITAMREGMAACKSVGIKASQTQQLGNYALACRNAGLVEEGLRVVAEALALVEETGERHFEAELLERKGELLLMSGEDKQNEAEACFHQALTIARRQKAKLWELRATISLSRLWQTQGKSSQARELLAEIYGWFSEGFDTRDLKEAGMLLKELG